MFKYLFVLALTVPFAFALDNFEACQNNGIGILPDYVNLEGCPTAPCKFTEGEFINAKAGMTVPYASSTLTTALVGYLSGMSIDFDLEPEVEAACNWLEGASCPLSGGEKIEYTLKTPVKGVPPAANGALITIEFSLRDDTGKNMACIRFPAYIYNAAKY